MYMINEANATKEMTMTNQEIIDLAKSKGYAAETVNGYGYTTKVLIQLQNRKVDTMEVSRELNISSSYFYPHHLGVTVYGSDS